MILTPPEVWTPEWCGQTIDALPCEHATCAAVVFGTVAEFQAHAAGAAAAPYPPWWRPLSRRAWNAEMQETVARIRRNLELARQVIRAREMEP